MIGRIVFVFRKESNDEKYVSVSAVDVCSLPEQGAGKACVTGRLWPRSRPALRSSSQHVHPTEGPHHGELVELGDEEFHAELVHDEATETLTVYLLDAAAVHAVGSKSPEVRINLSHDGTAQQYTLAAKRQLNDLPGESSRYISQDSKLCEKLDHLDGSAQLVVMIRDKQYRGKIEHDHGHHHELSQESILVK